MAKVKQQTIYTSDRGEEYLLADMEVSHLLNVLALHSRQVEVLERQIATREAASFDVKGLTKILQELHKTLAALTAELGKRGSEDGLED